MSSDSCKKTCTKFQQVDLYASIKLISLGIQFLDEEGNRGNGYRHTLVKPNTYNKSNTHPYDLTQLT